MKEGNSIKKKQQESNCIDAKPYQNHRVYEKRKKGKLKPNGVVALKWLARVMVGICDWLSVVQLSITDCLRS